MNTYQKLDKLRTDFEATIPGLLSAASLPAFDKFITGTPDEVTEKQLAFYFEKEESDTTTRLFNVIIQAQLVGVSDSDSWQIQDIIKSEILKYNPELIEEQSFSRLNVENFPIFETDTVILLFELQYYNDLDDCTIEG